MLTTPQAEILAGLGSLILYAKREGEINGRVELENLYIKLAKQWEHRG